MELCFQSAVFIAESPQTAPSVDLLPRTQTAEDSASNGFKMMPEESLSTS